MLVVLNEPLEQVGSRNNTMPRKPSQSSTSSPSAATPPATPQARRYSLRKRFIFAMLAFSIPLVLFGATELVLRLCGFGGYPPTILELGPTPDGVVCITDKAGPASYFFANRSKQGAINTFTFLKPKPKDTVRIFLAGGSAMKGFPQSMCFAPSAFLEAMLAQVWPGRRVEVINLGTTAIASFPVLGMVTEVLDYEPDLVVVYAGNNEFYGAFGVASLHWAGSHPLAMFVNRAVRSTALMQGIDRLIAGPPAGAPDRTLMEVMIGQDYVGPDDSLRANAARNLGQHVSEIISRCASRGVPTIVCSVAVNERDLAPLGTERLDDLAVADQKRVGELLAEADRTIVSDPSHAAELFQSAIKLYPAHARAHYQLGRALLARGNAEQARVAFDDAIDLDPMPWRCIGECNDALRRVAGEGKAIFCDTRQMFREASPGGCIGWELMDDHVHPTLLGQAVLARSIVQTMTGMTGPLAVSKEAYAKLASNEEFLKRLGDNMYDRYAVAHTLRKLLEIPFFKTTNPGAFERFDKLARDYESQMSPDVLTAARQWQDPKSHPGILRPITAMVGRVMIQRKDFATAETLYAAARKAVPAYSSASLEYDYFMLICRERLRDLLSDADREIASRAIERGKFMIPRGAADSGMVERYVGRLHQLRSEWEAAIPFLLASRPKVGGTDLVAVDQALIMSYRRTGRMDQAYKLVENGIQNSGQYAGMYRMLKAELDSPVSAPQP